ncbi:MAG: adenosylhomocysteinase [Ruminococcaceae bacterium]|nr:adenosylhomocysteinase [Oscillospiraceae bacterium]
MAHIKSKALAPSGKDKMDFVRSYMPVLAGIREEMEETRPLEGYRIAMSIHLEAKTACLAETLAAGGAEVRLTGCNPLSTQDDVAAAANEIDGVEVFGIHGATEEEYREDLIRVLDFCPHIIIDDGGDLVSLLHGDAVGYGRDIIGGCEETTTGVHRLKARAAAGELRFPMLDINDADCKHLFDNRYGTGQSTLEGIMGTTNLVIAGKTVVIAGYGWCGKGAAMRAKGLGAVVVITEIDPVKAVEAVMDGFTVMTMDEAAKVGDLFITLTGCADVIRGKHFMNMKDGALLANSGHFDVEINKTELEMAAAEVWERRPNITGYRLPDGRVLNLLAEGRLVNLAAGMGHPAEIMDMSFALQARGVLYMAKKGRGLEPGVYPVPTEIDRSVAWEKLASMNVKIDRLTPEQEEYLAGTGD